MLCIGFLCCLHLDWLAGSAGVSDPERLGPNSGVFPRRPDTAPLRPLGVIGSLSLPGRIIYYVSIMPRPEGCINQKWADGINTGLMTSARKASNKWYDFYGPGSSAEREREGGYVAMGADCGWLGWPTGLWPRGLCTPVWCLETGVCPKKRSRCKPSIAEPSRAEQSRAEPNRAETGQAEGWGQITDMFIDSLVMALVCKCLLVTIDRFNWAS